MIDDDPTNGQGFESAVAYALAEQMGFAAEDVQWVRTSFDEAIAPGDKPYDFNMQQYSITEERDQIVDFSMPYYVGQKSLILLNSSPAIGATTLADLESATFGATIGTTDLDYIENVIGIEDVAVYNTQADVVAAMLAGQIDATVVGLPTALYLTAVEIATRSSPACCRVARARMAWACSSQKAARSSTASTRACRRSPTTARSRHSPWSGCRATARSQRSLNDGGALGAGAAAGASNSERT
jgi:hypothetical protein